MEKKLVCAGDVHPFTRYADGKALAYDPQVFSKRCEERYAALFVDIHRVDTQRVLYEKAVDLGDEVRLDSRTKVAR